MEKKIESFSKKKATKEAEVVYDDGGVQGYLIHPTMAEPKSLTQEDVWGHWSEDHTKRLDKGMIVADREQICPIFGDTLPYKSVTAVCQKDQLEEVIYWLEYVHGGGSVSEVKELDNEKVAIRSDYQAW